MFGKDFAGDGLYWQNAYLNTHPSIKSDDANGICYTAPSPDATMHPDFTLGYPVVIAACVEATTDPPVQAEVTNCIWTGIPDSAVAANFSSAPASSSTKVKTTTQGNLLSLYFTGAADALQIGATCSYSFGDAAAPSITAAGSALPAFRPSGTITIRFL